MARSRAAPAPARSASSAASRPRPAASSTPAHSAPAHSQPSQPHAHHAAPAAPAAQPARSGWFGSKPAAPAPAPVAAAAPPALSSGGGGGGIMSGLMGSVVTGMAMGTGSAVAHRAVDSMMGPRETHVVHENAPAPAPAAPMASYSSPMHMNNDPCSQRVQEFSDCMSRSNGDMGACNFYFEAMQSCKTQNRMV